MSSAAIEVLELRPVTTAGNVRAFVKVKVGGFTIHGVKVIRQEGQKPWVALPQMPARTKADGKGSGWFPVIEATPELMAKIRAVVLAAWEQRQRDPRQDHINELARRFDERGPDDVEGAI